jgi:hypothetical protein
MNTPHELQQLLQRLRHNHTRMRVQVGPYEYNLTAFPDPVLQQFVSEFIEDLQAIIETRLADLEVPIPSPSEN